MDYINRKAYLDYLAETLVARMPSTFANGIWAAFNVARDFPAADVAPVAHGRWEPHYINNCGIKKHEGYTATCCRRWNKVKEKYCPNCGAKMDLEVTSND